MTSSLVNTAADALYHINPSMLKIPPRGLADEFCYMGPDGTEEGAIRCGELDDELAMSVGSWMIEPKQIATEGIVGIFVCSLALVWLVPKLRAISPTTIRVKHPKGSSLLSLFCLGMVLLYKITGFHNKMYYLVMPCNMQWVLSFLQCYVIPDSYEFVQFSILQLRLTYLMSVVIAIVTPETGDCTTLGEFEFYWFNHFVLLVLPLAYVVNGSVTCYPSENSRCSTLAYNSYWWLFSCIVFYIFYFGPATIMSISTGLNLNFMLHPPHDHFLLYGPNFRLVATASLGFFYTTSRLISLQVEKFFAGGNSENRSRSNGKPTIKWL